MIFFFFFFFKSNREFFFFFASRNLRAAPNRLKEEYGHVFFFEKNFFSRPPIPDATRRSLGRFPATSREISFLRFDEKAKNRSSLKRGLRENYGSFPENSNCVGIRWSSRDF